jgi:hypothetical protein
LEDLSDFIVENVDENFGFSRYAERLGRCAYFFDEIHAALQSEPSFIEKTFLDLLEGKLQKHAPTLAAVSVPFPGNLFAAFRAAQYIKKNHPSIKICMGGGFPNTELRSLSDARVFEYFDFITLDDGEKPLELLYEFVRGKKSSKELKRTFLLHEGTVMYCNESKEKDYRQSETGTPDYSDLPLGSYVSVIEVANPMHRLWSDGRWNKLTMAHGCYWGKCTFCDITLDYIKNYHIVSPQMLCDRVEELIAQTGNNGFHFTDEAAPPALMRDFALEIIKRRLVISWWTNIRFEKSFTKDLCLLLKASGCVAVSGGLEVASDRLLQLIEKGVTVAQTAQVCKNFRDAGIMVHAYLMYGYPTQTTQETIDSLEMVRQMFAEGVLHSGFWHQFALTSHSPIGHNPEKFKVKITNETVGSFANNDLYFEDATGENHEKFSFGLKKSLFNFMHGLCLDNPLQDWFDFKIPRTSVAKNYIAKAIENYEQNLTPKAGAKIVWINEMPLIEKVRKSKKGQTQNLVRLIFFAQSNEAELLLSEKEGEFLCDTLQKISIFTGKMRTLAEVKTEYESAFDEPFELFFFNKVIFKLRDAGLLIF